jgi:lipopolysaccharide/colanic/teichoic acid biosynthesis glycosyltransferase
MSGLGLLALSPLFTLLAIAIMSDSVGPILFSQTRIGQGGQSFKCWKFRSMHVYSEQRKIKMQDINEMSGDTKLKLKHDPRITRLGGFIRKASVDELPQLWNVFIGNMSLVGPRPSLPCETANYSAFERQRLIAKPGITCIWQVSGRSDLPFKEQVRLDIEYIVGRSVKMDLVLLLRTIPAVLFARGAR